MTLIACKYWGGQVAVDLTIQSLSFIADVPGQRFPSSYLTQGLNTLLFLPQTLTSLWLYKYNGLVINNVEANQI